MEAASPVASASSTSVVAMTSAAESAGSTPNGSAGPVVVQDTSVRVVESVKNRVVTNKTVVQRTTNTNAVQVNKYDAAGNLKSSDIDSTSWEDRDTQSYQWSNREQPPSEALAPPPTDDRIEQFFAAAEQQQQQDDQGTDGNRSALVLTTAERRDVPAVTWTGSSATHQADEKAGQEQHTTTKMGGSQWSRSGEAVWISSSADVAPASPSTTKAIDSADGPVTAATDGGDTSTAGGLSVDERRRRRCVENRSRKAAVANSTVTTSSSARTRPSPTPK